MPVQKLVELKGAGAREGDRWLVRDVDLAVSAGEIVTLIGPNGSGKTTTVKMALGLRRLQEGSVKRAPDLRVGYVPQRFSIDWTLPLTVGRLLSLTQNLSTAEMQAALALVSLEGREGTPVQALSGGEFQRALLARAIARRPNLLVLDEPVQGVDVSGEVALYNLITDIREQLNCGVLLISHDLHVVMAATDQVLCMNGHVCCRGAPGAVSQDAEYLKLFGARAEQALALYHHDDHHHHDHAHDHGHEHGLHSHPSHSGDSGQGERQTGAGGER